MLNHLTLKAKQIPFIVRFQRKSVCCWLMNFSTPDVRSRFLDGVDEIPREDEHRSSWDGLKMSPHRFSNLGRYDETAFVHPSVDNL
ncbi:hypothetical protein AVEN_49932-1 [Araneus ventricosus]|uniref:Uncharacterized protein n=1 Tax=Araneus ventricosus TaxID=182803 RepID=A0A4Y2DR95_ARAVE|nr:hypothetical protein AVEN_49932-1 [Araneus ventricosus]